MFTVTGYDEAGKLVFEGSFFGIDDCVYYVAQEWPNVLKLKIVFSDETKAEIVVLMPRQTVVTHINDDQS